MQRYRTSYGFTFSTTAKVIALIILALLIVAIAVLSSTAPMRTSRVLPKTGLVTSDVKAELTASRKQPWSVWKSPEGSLLESTFTPDRGKETGDRDELERYMPVPGGESDDLDRLEAEWHNRLTYPTGVFDPAWLRQALAQDKLIADAIPAGLPLKLAAQSGQTGAASSMSTTSFTALGPKPLRMTGCSGCYNYSLTSGRVNDIAIDPVTTNVAYIATVGGGVWKTTNCCTSTTSWAPTTDDPVLSTIGVDTVTIDPNNHETIYAGTGDLNYGSFSMGSQGILKSTDAGATWTLLGADVFGPALSLPAGQFPQYQAVGKVRVDPRNSNNVVAGTKSGLYLSYDGGNSWTGPCTTNGYGNMRQDITGLALNDVGGATRIIAAIGVRGFSTTVQYNLNQNGANGIYRGTMPSSGCPGDFTAVSRNDNGWTGLNAGSGVAYSNATTGNQLGRVDIAVAPSNPNYIYAQVQSITPNGNSGCGSVAGCQLGAYRTTDGGNTWTQIPGSPGASLLNCSGSAGDYAQNWYDQGVAVDPNNPDRVFFDTYEIWFWQNGNTSWNDTTCGYSGSTQVVHVDQHALAFVPGSSTTLLVGNDGGVHGTNNANAASAGSDPTWFNMDTGLNTIEFYSGDISGNFATSASPQANGGAQDNGSGSVTFNGYPTGPAQWQMGKGGDGFYARIDPVGNRFWQGNNSGHLSICLSNCTASGATWTDVEGPWSNPGSPDTQSFILPYEIYKGIPGDAANDCPASGCNHLIVGTYRVWETVSNGAGWYPVSLNLTKQTLGNRSFITQLAFAPKDQTHALVGTNDGNVQIGTGLGAGAIGVWTDVTGGNTVLPNRPILDVVFDPNSTTAPVAYAAVGGFNANTPTTPGHVFQVTCAAGCTTFVWADKTGNLPDIPVDSIVANPNYPQQVYAGTDWGLYFTNDITAAAPVWYRFQNALPHSMIWDMQIDRGATTLSVWTRGRGAYVWPLPTGPIDTSSPTPTPTPSATPTPSPTPTPTPAPTPYPPQSGDGTQVIQGTYDPNVYPCGSAIHQFIVPAGKSAITVQVNATVPANDLSVTLITPSGQAITEDTLTCCEALVYQPTGGVPAGTYQVQICQTPNTQGVPQTAPYSYVGTFSSIGTGSSSPTPTPTPTPSPTPTPTPASLTVGGPPVTWGAGPFLVANPTDQVDGVPTCDGTLPCSDFYLDVNVPAGYDDQHYVKVQVNWTNPGAQFDLFVYTVNADNSIGKLQAANFFAVDPDVVTISAVSGRYLLRVSPTIPHGDSYTGRVTLENKVGAATQGGISTPTFQNFQPPSGLGNSAGEPSIGVGLPGPGYPQGRAMFQSNTQMLRVTFNDNASPATALWENKSAPNAATSLDPILFTDRQTGRTLTSQLAGACSLAAYTDGASPFNDGDQWVPGQGCGVPAGVDHQTFGGGPLHAPLTTGAAYPNGVYYCSQYGTQAASCALSTDGGLTFGPSIPIFTVSCFGIHGHVKVAPDGTVYVPDSDCSSAGAQTIGDFPTATARQALVFSEDNGLTWSQPQLIPDSNPAPGIVDPSIGIGSNGTIYYGYANSNGAPSMAVGHLDKTNHKIVWSPSQDVGAPFGIKNATFPAVVAGDDDRAAFAFLGTPTAGYYQDQTIPASGAGFQGVWHLYVAITYNGGQTWTTIDATPNDPVQRGSICNSGTVICSRTPNDRNLLDFIDATIDRQGRVLVAYADGCTSPTCVNAGPTDYRKNDYIRKASIARLTTGRGLFREFDGLIGGQDVTSMIGLQMTNPKSGSGSASFDLALKNTSSQTIFSPLTLMVSNISSASGRVSVANAGNGKTGAGATWDYSGTVGSDNMLTGGELSSSRNLKFNNPANEPFTVTFSVVGVLASGGGGGSGGTSGSSSGTSGSGGTSTSSTGAVGTLTNALLSVTYNPLLNTVTWQVMRQ